MFSVVSIKSFLDLKKKQGVSGPASSQEQINGVAEIEEQINGVAEIEEPVQEPVPDALPEGGDVNEFEEPVQETQTENAPAAQAQGIIKEFNQDHIISDPGLRIPIERFHPNIRDEVKRAYLLKGPTQIKGHNFPRRLCGQNDYRPFQESWFTKYDWLELKMATGTKYPRTRGYQTRWVWIWIQDCARGHGHDPKPNGYLLTDL